MKIFTGIKNRKLNKKTKSRGATLIEYAMLVGLIGAGSIYAVGSTGTEVSHIFCEASNSMVQILGKDKNPDCLDTLNEQVTLNNNERFVDEPVILQSDFENMLFEKDEVGVRLVMSSIDPNPVPKFLLYTALTSRDPHEQSRTISACYTLGNGVDPICGAAGSSSQVSVPSGATAFGYLVNLSENTQLPWMNDITISISDYQMANNRDWNIEVGREESDAVLENVLVAFGPHTFGQSDTGWTYGPFAPLTGTFNRPLQLSMSDFEGPGRTRRACYIPSENASPICSSPSTQNSVASVTVAPGAVALGYQIQLPAPSVGVNWAIGERFVLSQNGTQISSEDVLMDRPGAPYQIGAALSDFTDFTFAQSDVSFTEGQFIGITIPRNVPLSMSVIKNGGELHRRQACYKTVSGGPATCGDIVSTFDATGKASISVPVNAVEVGYKIELPAMKSGPDTVYQDILELIAPNGVSLQNASVNLTRPNTPYQIGAVLTNFSDFSFARTATDMTEGQFIGISGPRNTVLTMAVVKNGGDIHRRQACYKTVSGGAATCGEIVSTFDATGKSSISVPIDAVEVGYKVELPATKSGPDTVYQDILQLTGPDSVSLQDVEVNLTRPNTPYEVGAVATSFSDFSFVQASTGLTEGQFIGISGPRNTALTMSVVKNGGDIHRRQACYKTVSGGEPICGSLVSTFDATGKSNISVPIEAVEVGYRVELPATKSGPDTIYQDTLQLIAPDNVFLQNVDVNITRPNAPYQAGGIAGTFSNYTFTSANTSWTDGQFIALTGVRNTNLTMGIYKDGGAIHSRRACYKLTSGGASVCGSNVSSSDSFGYSTVSVPVDAVEVGYMIELPAVAAGPSNVYQNIIRLTGPVSTLQEASIVLTRPNAAYKEGAVTGNFSDVTFGKTDTGWSDVQFLDFTGDTRNTVLTMSVGSASGTAIHSRRACYKVAGNNTAVCGSSVTSNSGSPIATVSVPTTATKVGYQIQLPVATIGNDFVYKNTLSLTGSSTTIIDPVVATVTRTNTPYQEGGVSGSFSNVNLTSEKTSWTKAQYLALTGPRNTTLTLSIFKSDPVGTQHYRRACYTTVVGGTETCGTPTYNTFASSTATFDIPTTAVEVGYQILLPAIGPGANNVYTDTIELKGSSGTIMTSSSVTVTRINNAYQEGGVASSFTDVTLKPSDVSWTSVQYIGLTGTRNTDLDFNVYADGGSVLKRACYRTVAGGATTCGGQSYQTSTVTVPANAVEVGYDIAVGATSTTTTFTYKSRLELKGPTKTLQNVSVTATRPTS
jgi:Flp pilus assembly pilin Flp